MSATFNRRRPFLRGGADGGGQPAPPELTTNGQQQQSGEMPHHPRRGTNDFGGISGIRQPPNAGAAPNGQAGNGPGGTNDSLTLGQQKAAQAALPKEKVCPSTSYPCLGHPRAQAQHHFQPQKN